VCVCACVRLCVCASLRVCVCLCVCQALGIEHTPFEATSGLLLPEEPPDLLLPMQPLISVSTAARDQLTHLREVHELVTFVLRVHKDGI
jgi:hypothetical protein